MGKADQLLQRITDSADLSCEPVPGMPILELAGDNRILIEHHRGIREYTVSRIRVCVSYGMVCVSGSSLELLQMTREKLIISGKIDCITIIRRE